MTPPRLRAFCFLLAALAVPSVLTADEPMPNEEAKPDERLVTESVIQSNIDGNQLAGLFERFSGKKVIVTKDAAAARFSFVQEASKEDPITFREAEELVRKSAILENFVFIPHPTSPKTIVLAQTQSKPFGCRLSVEVYNSSNPLPNDDRVITYVMTLRHIETKKAVELLKAHRDKSKNDGSIAAVPHATAIVITDKVSNVRKLIDLQSKFDQPSSNPKKEPKPRQLADELQDAWQGRVSDASCE